MLIVNADDAGIDRETTDAIVECLQSGAITSTTAMAWMADSPRAAEELSKGGFPVGLHLNMIEPYTAANVPPAARERQARVASYFRRFTHLRWLYNPRIRADVDACIADQLDCFIQLYGGAPTHVDGHQHSHLYPNVLFSRSLQKVERIRPAFTFVEGEKSGAKRAFRSALNQLIHRRFLAPQRFRSIRTIVPQLGGSALTALTDADRFEMEVMCHPGWADERGYLTSDQWRAQLAGRTLGSYADLRRGPVPTPLA